MPRRKPLPGGSRAAAAYAAEHGVSFAVAGRAHGVSREAVRQAWDAMFTAPPRPRLPRVAEPRDRVITALGSHRSRLTVRVTEAERKAYLAAAGETPLATWLGRILDGLRGDRSSTALRVAANTLSGIA